MTGATLRREPCRVAVWNPESGSAPTEAELCEALGGQVEIVATTAADPGTGQAGRAVANGASTVIVCGGDGTVRATLESLAASDAALAIVPTGTGNLLAANLGVPTGLDAARLARFDDHRRIDLGRVDGEPFAVMSGCGFDAGLIGGAEDGPKARLGSAAYLVAGLRRLHTDRVRTTVEVDGVAWYDGRASMVLVGNFSTISGGIVLFPDAEPDDGLLDVMVLESDTVRSWAKVAWRVLRRRPLPSDLGRTAQGTEISVRLDRPRPYELDGEMRDATDQLHFTVDPGALLVHEQGD